MTEERIELKKKKGEEKDANLVKTVREGAVAASIWRRQSPTGFPYYDFSLSRSWKSMSSGTTGYSQNFFDRNKAEMLSVIERACVWIAEQPREADAANQAETLAA